MKVMGIVRVTMMVMGKVIIMTRKTITKTMTWFELAQGRCATTGLP